MFAFLVFKKFYSCLSGPVRIEKHDFVPHPIVGNDSETPPPQKKQQHQNSCVVIRHIKQNRANARS